MDVQCERCKTEYVFDDALVSGRGTTVRCTSCGHEFKVRRPDAVDASGDRWVVQSSAGAQYTFLTLRELQRAILAKQVARQDLLLQGGTAPRPLSSIAELEPLFDGRTSSRPPPTPDNGAGGAPGGARGAWADGPPIVEGAGADGFHAPPPGRSAAVPPFHGGQPHAGVHASARPAHRAEASDEDETRVAPPPSTDEPYDIPGRRRVGGWIVALVLVMSAGIGAWVLAKPYLVGRSDARSSEGATALDGKARAFLADGEKAMADGNLEAAQQSFDKASALAEGDSRVLVDEARVAAAEADVPWLELRILDRAAVEEARAARSLLDERVARARKAATDAVAAAPDDPAAARAQIDALRLAGERDAARSYVPKVGPVASQPETVYVLAALDLAEAEPFWMTVIDRLRRVAAAEGGAGRARAALVFALAKSGDVVAAKAELTKLDGQARPYPLLPKLHAWIDDAAKKSPLDATKPVEAAAASASGRAGASGGPGQGGSAQGTGDGISSDPAIAMQQAATAIKRGETSRARHIYEGLVARNPDDSEALSGIGDVERMQGDSAGAVASYKRALVVNPSYLPALLGVADTQWATGSRSAARASYKDIADRFPEGSYPPYVATRAEEPQASPAPAAAAAAPPAATASAPKKPWDPGDGI
jgi:predicted Zn finger-like uncharacterized protein